MALVVGSKVRVKDPEAYIRDIARRVENRIGEVTGFQRPTPNPIVTFHKEGRRQQFIKAFEPSALELVQEDGQ